MRRFSFFVCVLLSAPAWAQECSTVPGNIMPACGFESPEEVAAWTLLEGDVFNHGALQGETGDSGRIDALESGGPVWTARAQSPCLLGLPDEPISFGFSLRQASAIGSATVDCTINLSRFSDTQCQDAEYGSSFVAGELTGSYQSYLEADTLGPATASFVTRFSCFSSDEDFDVDVDNALAITAPVAGPDPVVDVPTLDSLGIAVLSLLLAAVGWHWLVRHIH